MVDLNSRPVEVSIFGGGVGECIVVKFQEECWMVIDSCRDPISKRPIALKYFAGRGIDYKNCVKYIMATHWHDDHINGIADLVQECSSAKFIASIALNKDEFYSLVSTNEHHARILKEKTSGVREFYQVFSFLESHNCKERLIWAKCDQLIERMGDIEIWTLSPSNKEITLAMQRMVQFLPKIKESLKIIPEKGPNHTAVVTFIKIANLKLLFGADLEETSDPSCGWSAIISDSNSLEQEIKLIKVPHHGSRNAHNNVLWENYLLRNGVALLTPYNRSRLPRNDDINRITHFLKESYCTSPPNPKKIRKQYDRAVAKTIKEATKFYRAFRENMGQVKFEYDFAKREGTIETFGAAKRLIDFRTER